MFERNYEYFIELAEKVREGALTNSEVFDIFSSYKEEIAVLLEKTADENKKLAEEMKNG